MAKGFIKKRKKDQGASAFQRLNGRRLRDRVIKARSLGPRGAKKAAARAAQWSPHDSARWEKERYGLDFGPQLTLTIECGRRSQNIKRVMRALMDGARFDIGTANGGLAQCPYLISAVKTDMSDEGSWDLALRTGIDPLMRAETEDWGFEALATINANQLALSWWRRRGYPLDRVDGCGADPLMLAVENGERATRALLSAWPGVFSWSDVADRVYDLAEFKRRRIANETDPIQIGYQSGGLFDDLFRVPAVETISVALIEQGLDYLRPNQELSDYMRDVGADDELIEKVACAEKERMARFEREQLAISVGGVAQREARVRSQRSL